MKRKTDKRKALLKAAKELFHTKGYNDTTIDDIIHKAGVGKGTFYRYFRNKTELLVLKMDRIHDGFRKILTESLKPDFSLEKNLETALNAFLDYYRKHIVFFRILDEQSLKYPDEIGLEIRKRINENLKYFRQFVVENILKKRLRQIEPDLILHLLFMFFHGAKEIESKTGMQLSKKKQKELINLILKGIENDE